MSSTSEVNKGTGGTDLPPIEKKGVTSTAKNLDVAFRTGQALKALTNPPTYTGKPLESSNVDAESQPPSDAKAHQIAGQQLQSPEKPTSAELLAQKEGFQFTPANPPSDHLQAGPEEIQSAPSEELEDFDWGDFGSGAPTIPGLEFALSFLVQTEAPKSQENKEIPSKEVPDKGPHLNRIPVKFSDNVNINGTNTNFVKIADSHGFNVEELLHNVDKYNYYQSREGEQFSFAFFQKSNINFAVISEDNNEPGRIENFIARIRNEHGPIDNLVVIVLSREGWGRFHIDLMAAIANMGKITPVEKKDQFVIERHESPRTLRRTPQAEKVENKSGDKESKSKAESKHKRVIEEDIKKIEESKMKLADLEEVEQKEEAASSDKRLTHIRVDQKRAEEKPVSLKCITKKRINNHLRS